MDVKLKNCCTLLHALLKHKYEVLNSSTVQNKLNGQLHTKGTYSKFNYIQKFMDKIPEEYMRESIKNTMLKHEEIFKQQVCELHRLYRVQTMLMIELRGEEERMKSFVDTSNPQIAIDATYNLQSSRTSSEATHSSYASDRINSHAVLNSGREAVHASPELLKCLKPLGASKGYILQHHGEGESIESRLNEDCNLDLSLSIGCASDKLKSAGRKEIMKGSARLLPSSLIREESGKECTDSAVGFGAESLKRPHWLFQAMSLNRT